MIFGTYRRAFCLRTVPWFGFPWVQRSWTEKSQQLRHLSRPRWSSTGKTESLTASHRHSFSRRAFRTSCSTFRVCNLCDRRAFAYGYFRTMHRAPKPKSRHWLVARTPGIRCCIVMVSKRADTRMFRCRFINKRHAYS